MVHGFWSLEKEGWSVRLDPIDDSIATKAFKNYLHANNLDAGNYRISMFQFGNKTRFFYTWTKRLQPVTPDTYKMSADGSISHKDYPGDLLMEALNVEFSSVSSNSVGRFIEISIQIDTDNFVPPFKGQTKIISATKEIPGYEKQPLDEDLAQTVRPIHSYKNRKGETVFIAYAYTRVGGVVRRYRFVFENLDNPERRALLSWVECSVLARDIGDALYLA